MSIQNNLYGPNFEFCSYHTHFWEERTQILGPALKNWKKTSDYAAKFHGDRLRELKDFALKKKRSAVKRKAAGNYRSR